VASLVAHAVPALLLAATLYNCGRVGTELGKSERAEYKIVSSPPLASMDPKILDTMLLGHGGLYDDFAMIWSIQILAEPNLKKMTTADELSDTLLRILKHQPKIEGIYLLSCYVLGLDFQRGDLCDKISIEGLKAFPDSWRIPMTQGFMASFVAKDDLKAAAFYELAASRPKSPEYVGRLAKRLTARGYADGEDLSETVRLMSEVPGGSRIIEILQQRLKNSAPPAPPGVSP
jgi:hypothetical protein